MLPVIWVMELDLLQHRLDERDQLASRLNNPSAPPIIIKGLDIKAVFDDDVAAKKVGELGVVVLIIIGRWLLPRGQLTRDQLSALLLGYIGMGADILDLFGSLSQERVEYNVNMHYVTLAVFSWSMLQFCITATVTAGCEEMPSEIDRLGVSDATNCPITSPIVEGLGGPETKDSKANSRRFKLDADLLQILVPIFMQDGPFLALRLVMILKFHVTDEVHIYFTGKNALTLVLLLYRLYCLKTGERVDPPQASTRNEVFMVNEVARNTNQEIPGGLSNNDLSNKDSPNILVSNISV